MAATSSDGSITLELRGHLADRLAELGQSRGTRREIPIDVEPDEKARHLLERIATADPRYTLLYDPENARLTEYVEVVLNDRLLDLQGGLDAELHPGDILLFLPAHAGGSPT